MTNEKNGYILYIVSTQEVRVLMRIESERRALITELSARKEKILSAVTEYYTSTGEPVGSKLVCSVLPLSVSSATVRNEMAELSDLGYLEQPHTSAGRIPSDKGFKYYVEKLMPHIEPSDSEALRIISRLDFNEGDRRRVLKQGCDALAAVTGKAAVATTPASNDAVVKGVRLVPLAQRTAMVIVMTSAGTFKSRIARLGEDIDFRTAELFCNTCTANFVGRKADEITTADVQSAASSMGEATLVTAPLLVCMQDALRETVKTDVIIGGRENLLKNPLMRQRAAELMELLDDTSTMYEVLRDRPKEGLSVNIGRENRVPCLENAAVATAVYTAGGERGLIGVICPVKTDYSHMLPLVSFTANAVSRILNEMKGRA